METSRLTRDGTTDPVSRDQILRRERGQGNFHFPCSVGHVQDCQPYPVDSYSSYMCDHIYIHTTYMCVCCLPIYAGRTSRGHTGGRSHRISPPSFCGACLNFSCEKDSAVPFPRRPWSWILYPNKLIVLHLLGTFIIFYLFIYFCEETYEFVWLHRDSNSRHNVRRFRGYQLNHRGDRLW